MIPGASEHQIQTAFFERVRWRRLQDQRWRNIAATPNGGKRYIHTALMLKDEGVEPGFPDITIAYPSGRFHGAYIETKTPAGRMSNEQRDWAERLWAAGYLVAIGREPQAMERFVEDYFERPEKFYGRR